jgi:hypothetical protein
MKKHRGGVGVTPSGTQCSHIDSKSARCRLFATSDSDLCPHHTRQQAAQQRRQDKAVAKSLLEDMQDFSTPDSVNVFLGNLLREVVLKRVDRRDAATLAYISQLLLNSHVALDRSIEIDTEMQSRIVAQWLQSQRNAPAGESPRQSIKAATDGRPPTLPVRCFPYDPLTRRQSATSQ